MKLPINWEKLKSLPPEQRKEAERLLAELQQIREENPLEFFEPHSDQQREFFEARTKIVAVFAGNRFGKTTSLAVRSLIECLDREMLPERLRPYKRFEAPAHGWIVCPTGDKIYDSLIPAIQKWLPRAALKAGKWEGSWSKERKQLTFANGSTITFKTYEQDPATLGGAALHFVGYDEPPPLATREECWTRLTDYKGFEMYAMTPLKTNTGWIRRDIFKKREAPHITVLRGSMRDNSTLDPEEIELTLAEYSSDLWRQAREFGDFVNVGGQIYPEFERCVLKKPPAPEFIRELHTIVSIDPGIRNAGIVWTAFDRDNTAWVFDELLLQDKTAADYAKAIREKNKRWGLERRQVHYVCDPAARQRGQANAETVMNLLIKEGIACNTGQNDVQAGIDQLRVRMQHKRFWVSPDCRGLRDEADDYAAEEPGEGKDDSHLVPKKGNDHRLDALRYGVMERVWDPIQEQRAPQKTLGWEPGRALPASDLLRGGPVEAPPMSSMS